MGMQQAHADSAEVRIEPYREADAPAVLELSLAVQVRQDEVLGNPLWRSLEDVRRELASWPVAPEWSLYVAREGGRVIGLAGVECHPESGHGLLCGPIVEGLARDRGVGRALLDVACRSARRNGVTELWAAAGRENRRAERILRAEGFARGEVDALYRLTSGAHQGLEDERRVSLHRATASDRGEALALAAACQSPALDLEDVDLLLADASGHVYLAGDAGSRVGLVAIDPVDRWVYGLAVHETVRGRGYAAAMLSAALHAYWAELPDHELGLTVRIENLAAINLYRRLGFEPWTVVATFSRSL
jgi:ribosomal protein S18 acetylase RimI-like enzyme